MKRSFQLIHFISFLLISFNGMAQSERINTDRPDQTDGTYTIPVNTFQIENGVTFSANLIINNFMLRYGAGKSTEIRLAIDAGKEDGLNGLKPVTFSLKQRFTQQTGALPAIALIGELSVGKFASKSFQSNELPFALKIALDKDLSDKFSLGGNLGTSDRFTELDLTFEGVYSLADNASVYLEYFSDFHKTTSDHNLDAGILYGITRRFQIDFACGISLGNSGTPFFATTGISYLFD